MDLEKSQCDENDKAIKMKRFEIACLSSMNEHKIQESVNFQINRNTWDLDDYLGRIRIFKYKHKFFLTSFNYYKFSKSKVKGQPFLCELTVQEYDHLRKCFFKGYTLDEDLKGLDKKWKKKVNIFLFILLVNIIPSAVLLVAYYSNYEVVRKMSFYKLIGCGIGLLCGLFVTYFLFWMCHKLLNSNNEG